MHQTRSSSSLFDLSTMCSQIRSSLSLVRLRIFALLDEPIRCLFFFRTNSCISYGNYKYFVLFLGYTFVFCLFVAGSSLEYFIQFWGVSFRSSSDKPNGNEFFFLADQNLVNSQQVSEQFEPRRSNTRSHISRSAFSQTSSANEMISTKFQMLFLFFIAIMFAISVSSLFFYHLYLTSKNRTTLGPIDHFSINWTVLFDFSCFGLIRVVPGTNLRYWTGEKWLQPWMQKKLSGNLRRPMS